LNRSYLNDIISGTPVIATVGAHFCITLSRIGAAETKQKKDRKRKRGGTTDNIGEAFPLSPHVVLVAVFSSFKIELRIT